MSVRSVCWESRSRGPSWMRFCAHRAKKLTNHSTRGACDIADAAKFLAGVRAAGCARAGSGPSGLRRLCGEPESSFAALQKAGRYEHVWSVRINEQYRAVGARQGDTVVWVGIGSHNDFDKLFG